MSFLPLLHSADAGAARRVRPWRLPLAAGLLAALAACGGGGGDATDPPVAATTSYTAGAITGFGSVIVNGVRFDDSAATVEDDDGVRHGADDLRLGVQVEVVASSIDRVAGTGVATLIRFGSEIKGPVESVDVAAGRLTVLGQAVMVTPRTVFDDSLAGGLAGVALDALVEVHGQYDAAQAAVVATRIEAEDSTSAYRLRGELQALDTAARTFRIGEALIRYDDATRLDTALANGARVKLRLQTTPVDGAWLATRVQGGRSGLDDGDHAEAEVTGRITAWTSATAFSVDGLHVDARSATFREGPAGVVLGALVEVEGRIENGVLIASQVHLEDEDDEDEHERGEDYELHGTVTGLDTAARQFSLRGLTVRYSDGTVWRDLSEAQLADGLQVEVKGNLSADGTVLEATRVSAEDD
ncbi:DUF5666 domain-containing protein [Ideonella sp.]|uniref:DUF5666 domain-containing protein n=1 Tax=Ideonella sp. TaxID=1929293 RepID=UPI0035B1FC3F